MSRHASRYAIRAASGVETEARARVAAVMLATLPGTSFLYYGEEIGMTDVPVPPEQATDPNGRDPVRTPMQWDLAANAAGFSSGQPWRPVPGRGVDVATQMADPNSLLHLYRQLLRLRRSHPCLTSGNYHELATSEDVYAYRRDYHGQALVILLNFGDQTRRADIAPGNQPSAARILASSHPTATGTRLNLNCIDLRANQAIVAELKPAKS